MNLRPTNLVRPGIVHSTVNVQNRMCNKTNFQGVILFLYFSVSLQQDRQCTYTRYIEVRSCNHCWLQKE